MTDGGYTKDEVARMHGYDKLPDDASPPLVESELAELRVAAEAGTVEWHEVIRLFATLDTERAARLAAEAERDRYIARVKTLETRLSRTGDILSGREDDRA